MKNTANTDTTSITTIDDLREYAAGTEKLYQSMRGSKALANLIGNVKITIDRIRSTVDPDIIADWFIEKGIAVSSSLTSEYPPFIAAICGEPHVEGKTFTDANGAEHVIWVSDRSMEIYFHTMEELDHLGIKANFADAIMGQGGAAKMARNRQKRLKENSANTVAAEKRSKLAVFLEEAVTAPLDLSQITLPVDKDGNAREFFTILCRHVGGQVVSLGIADENGSAKVNQIAKARYASLIAARKERERLTQQEADTQLRVEKARTEERNRIAKLKPAELAAMKATAQLKAAKKTKAAA